jgi:hypothetical protein
MGAAATSESSANAGLDRVACAHTLPQVHIYCWPNLLLATLTSVYASL